MSSDGCKHLPFFKLSFCQCASFSVDPHFYWISIAHQLSQATAVLLSAVLFAAHHTACCWQLDSYLPSPLEIPASSAVARAGAAPWLQAQSCDLNQSRYCSPSQPEQESMRSSDISAGASGREIHFLSCYIFMFHVKAQSCCSHLDILSGEPV